MNLVAGLFDAYPLIAGLFDTYRKASSTKRLAGLFDAYSLLEIGTYKPSSVVCEIQRLSEMGMGDQLHRNCIFAAFTAEGQNTGFRRLTYGIKLFQYQNYYLK